MRKQIELLNLNTTYRYVGPVRRLNHERTRGGRFVNDIGSQQHQIQFIR